VTCVNCQRQGWDIVPCLLTIHQLLTIQMRTLAVLKQEGLCGPPQMTVPSFARVIEHYDSEFSMTDADLAGRINALKQAVSKAKAAIERRRQEADALSREMAAQSADNAKLQVELDRLQAVAKFDAHWQRVCREHL